MLKSQFSRLLQKRTISGATTPSIGPSSDHTDGSWGVNDIYPGEFFWNMEDKKLWLGYETSGGTQDVELIYPCSLGTTYTATITSVNFDNTQIYTFPANAEVVWVKAWIQGIDIINYNAGVYEVFGGFWYDGATGNEIGGVSFAGDVVYETFGAGTAIDLYYGTFPSDGIYIRIDNNEANTTKWKVTYQVSYLDV